MKGTLIKHGQHGWSVKYKSKDNKFVEAQLNPIQVLSQSDPFYRIEPNTVVEFELVQMCKNKKFSWNENIPMSEIGNAVTCKYFAKIKNPL